MDNELEMIWKGYYSIIFLEKLRKIANISVSLDAGAVEI
jgi:hypothetical protein